LKSDQVGWVVSIKITDSTGIGAPIPGVIYDENGTDVLFLVVMSPDTQINLYLKKGDNITYNSSSSFKIIAPIN